MIWPWEPLSFSMMLHASWQAVRGASLMDLFDVAAVTTFIYLVLIWIRHARTLRILQGMVVMAVLYAAASSLHLALTTSLFRGFWTVLIVTLLSLFQEDVRRIFERLTVYERTTTEPRTLGSIARAASRMAKSHIGALIVIKGMDPLDRHLEGGHPLNGQISRALLESLFDPHSDGHDGAVIVEGDRVTRFGVHLPLSRNLDQESGLGTRHAAALGISEVSDALCIVVSEQRGSVAMVRNGRLTRTVSYRLLHQRLRDYLLEKAPTPILDTPWKILWNRPREKMLSLAFGLVLWLVLVKGIRPAEATFEIPVAVRHMPMGAHLKTVVPTRATVTVKGLQCDLRGDLSAKFSLEADLHGTHPRARHIPLGLHQTDVPDSLRVVSISPESVVLHLERSIVTVASDTPRRHATWFHLK